MPCRTKTLAKSPATSVTYCEDCKCYYLSIGPVTCRLDEQMLQQAIETLSSLSPLPQKEPEQQPATLVRH